jgi:hypothetical protein
VIFPVNHFSKKRSNFNILVHCPKFGQILKLLNKEHRSTCSHQFFNKVIHRSRGHAESTSYLNELTKW